MIHLAQISEVIGVTDLEQETVTATREDFAQRVKTIRQPSHLRQPSQAA